MELGAFSISLNVKNLQASKKFYETLGFREFGGDMSQNWLIMKNGFSVIGLFQGMFDKNIITFNPGWSQDAEKLKKFTDIRRIRNELKSKGIEVETDADETDSGPGSFSIFDPDGNPVLFDQHV